MIFDLLVYFLTFSLVPWQKSTISYCIDIKSFYKILADLFTKRFCFVIFPIDFFVFFPHFAAFRYALHLTSFDAWNQFKNDKELNLQYLGIFIECLYLQCKIQNFSTFVRKWCKICWQITRNLEYSPKKSLRIYWLNRLKESLKITVFRYFSL